MVHQALWIGPLCGENIAQGGLTKYFLASIWVPLSFGYIFNPRNTNKNQERWHRDFWAARLAFFPTVRPVEIMLAVYAFFNRTALSRKEKTRHIYHSQISSHRLFFYGKTAVSIFYWTFQGISPVTWRKFPDFQKNLYDGFPVFKKE